MVWDKDRITEFRSTLGLDQVDFAKALGVEPRTVARWEGGLARPTGAAEAVLNGLTAKIRQDPGSLGIVAGLISSAVALGGLSFLLFTLLDRATKSETAD